MWTLKCVIKSRFKKRHTIVAFGFHSVWQSRGRYTSSRRNVDVLVPFSVVDGFFFALLFVLLCFLLCNKSVKNGFLLLLLLVVAAVDADHTFIFLFISLFFSCGVLHTWLLMSLPLLVFVASSSHLLDCFNGKFEWIVMMWTNFVKKPIAFHSF